MLCRLGSVCEADFEEEGTKKRSMFPSDTGTALKPTELYELSDENHNPHFLQPEENVLATRFMDKHRIRCGSISSMTEDMSRNSCVARRNLAHSGAATQLSSSSSAISDRFSPAAIRNRFRLSPNGTLPALSYQKSSIRQSLDGERKSACLPSFKEDDTCIDEDDDIGEQDKEKIASMPMSHSDQKPQESKHCLEHQRKSKAEIYIQLSVPS